MAAETRTAAIAHRCFGDGDPHYERYHDTEGGFPVPDERALFELLSLEAFQAGLSWRTILAKRDAFRSAFANFDADAVSRFDSANVKRLLNDASIVRNRAKIEATINNARRYAELRREAGSLAAYGNRASSGYATTSDRPRWFGSGPDDCPAVFRRR